MRRFAASATRPRPRRPGRRPRAAIVLAGLCGAPLAAAPPDARAQIALPGEGLGRGAPLSKAEPVTFRADSVDYDSKAGLVTWTGHVEIWQNDHILRADRVTFDRNTNVAAASGHVAILEPDGQVLFADYAELTQGMREGVMTNMRAILAANGKLAANGSRRTDGKVNDLSRAVYTACKVCAQHPERPPFWQMRAYDATDDLEHKRIEYRDVYLDLFGLPVFYLPFFSTPDPSVKRQSGFLLGDISPHDKHLGTYATLPYFWAINRSTDMTFVPLVASATGPQLTAQYRERFNNGVLHVTGAIAYDTESQNGFYDNGNYVEPSKGAGVSGYLFLHSLFNYDAHWRYGADINVASSANYMRDYRITGYGADVLGSNLYVEGFGVGAYSRLDTNFYQGLNAGVINSSELPFVLPRYTYTFTGEPDGLLGGRTSVYTNDFNIYRANGTSDQRLALALNYERPFQNVLGQLTTVTAHLDTELYKASKLDLLPNYSAVNAATTVQALPTVAIKTRWPFLKTTHNGSVVIEPIVQLIAAPQSGNSRNDNRPNEDSLDYEFTDTTLFSLNRHEGMDRLDGGLRANVGLHGDWTFGGQEIDGLVGESYQQHIDQNQLPNSGLMTHASDIVSRLTFTPTHWLDFTVRDRMDHETGQTKFADALATAGVKLLTVSAGYVYNSRSFYYYYNNNPFTVGPPAAFYVPTNEATLGASSTWKAWRVSGYGRRDLANNRFVALGADLAYSNDCFIFDVSLNRRYTSINGDSGDTSVLFTVTFKTLGTFPVNG